MTQTPYLKPRKRGADRVIRTTITMPPVLWEAAQRIIQTRGFCGLSDYIQSGIRRDGGLDAELHSVRS